MQEKDIIASIDLIESRIAAVTKSEHRHGHGKRGARQLAEGGGGDADENRDDKAPFPSDPNQSSVHAHHCDSGKHDSTDSAAVTLALEDVFSKRTLCLYYSMLGDLYCKLYERSLKSSITSKLKATVMKEYRTRAIRSYKAGAKLSNTALQVNDGMCLWTISHAATPASLPNLMRPFRQTHKHW
jgi:hypothetical protein